MKIIWRLSIVLLVLMNMLTAFSSCTNDDRIYGDGIEDYIRVKGFKPMYEYHM